MTHVYLPRQAQLAPLLRIVRRLSPSAKVDTHPFGRVRVRVSVEDGSIFDQVTATIPYLGVDYWEDSQHYWLMPSHRLPSSSAFRRWRPEADPAVKTALQGFRSDQMATASRVMRLIDELQRRGYNSAEITEKLIQIGKNEAQRDARTIRKAVKRDPLMVQDGNVMPETEQLFWVMRERGGDCVVTAKQLPHFRSAVQNSFLNVAQTIMQLSPQ